MRKNHLYASVCVYAPGHEHKLLSPSGVNAPELPCNWWFWQVGLVIRSVLLARAKETDDDFAIDLELYEDDLHFDKKKKLLQNKGFNPKEQIYLKSSSGPDWISTTLKVMLQIARIIQLDEVKIPILLFKLLGRMVEALNSILSLLDISLSSGMCMQMNVLQELREAIIGMIRDFGDKNSVKTTILENHSCGKEECLLQWGENNGIRTRLQIAYVEGAGRGAIARENLNVGDIAVEIPVSTVISEELIRESNMFHILEKIDGISSETMLLLWSMNEKHNCNSKFKIYFNTLLEEFVTGLSFGIEAIMALDGTMMLEEIVQAKQKIDLELDLDFVLVGCFLFYVSSVLGIALSRGVSNGDIQDFFPMYFWNLSEVYFLLLLTFCSLLQIYPHILHCGKVDPATNSLKFCLSRPCSEGEQCFLSYGNFSSSHLLTFYGFLPQGDNPYDVIPMDFEAEQEDCMEGNPRLDWTTHMVRGTWLSNNHNIFYYGLPLLLLDYLHRAKNPMLQTKSLLQSNLENEMEVLGDLLSAFDGMMENLGETDLNDREKTSWDVRLAEEFKDQQRRIVSSVLTSCHKGIRLVENELRKCMNEDTRG
nr:uncharacterized protein LOC112027303 [Quercus suber]